MKRHVRKCSGRSVKRPGKNKSTHRRNGNINNINKFASSSRLVNFHHDAWTERVSMEKTTRSCRDWDFRFFLPADWTHIKFLCYGHLCLSRRPKTRRDGRKENETSKINNRKVNRWSSCVIQIFICCLNKWALIENQFVLCCVSVHCHYGCSKAWGKRDPIRRPIAPARENSAIDMYYVICVLWIISLTTKFLLVFSDLREKFFKNV